MATFKELTERRLVLKQKLDVLTRLKEHAENTIRADHPELVDAVDEVLVDLDASVVVQIEEEIAKIETTEFSDGKARKRTAKKKASKPKAKAKGRGKDEGPPDAG